MLKYCAIKYALFCKETDGNMGYSFGTESLLSPFENNVVNNHSLFDSQCMRKF